MIKEKSLFYDNTSDKLQKMVDDFVSDDFKVGDNVDVEGRYLKRNRSQNEDAINVVKVVEVKETVLLSLMDITIRILGKFQRNIVREIHSESVRTHSPKKIGTEKLKK